MSESPLHPLPMHLLLILYPPLFKSKTVLCSYNKSSSQVPRSLNSFGNFRGLGAFLSFFASIDREFQSLLIWKRNSVNFGKGTGPGCRLRWLREPASRHFA